MKFKLVELGTRAGKITNEDRVGYTDSMAWVIDGATPVGANNLFSGSDTAWLVDQLQNQLTDSAIKEKSLVQHIGKCIQKIAQLATDINPNWRSLSNYQLPSFAIAAVRIIEKNLEVCILGDCSIIYQGNNYKNRFTDERIKKFSDQSLLAMLDPNRSLQEQLRENRNMMNHKDGYWIGDLSGVGFEHAITSRFELESGSSLILFSDGYERIVDHYRKLNYDQLIHTNIEETISLIRNIEDSDADCKIYPRIKKSDDATAIRLVLEK